MANGARLISNLWAASWISFGIASGISQGLTFVRVVFDLAISGLFFALLQCLARRRAVLGGLLLLLIRSHPHGGFTGHIPPPSRKRTGHLSF